MKREKELAILREQLGQMIAFMQATIDPANPHRGAWWWAGDVPAHPELYEPDDWEVANKPIWQVWDQFLGDLRSAGLTDRLKEAQELPIADLLADTGTCYN